MTGLVFDIQRFCTHDGPGIRTTVFLKGCPLRCAWCHNPEAQDGHPELAFTSCLCIGCGGCVRVCPAGAHTLTADGHTLDRDLCQRCLRCAGECPSPALEAVGVERTVADVMSEVEADRVFYEATGGGMTLSGGEPMAQPEFALALLRSARDAGIATCVETSGAGSRSNYGRAAPLSDLFLWDVKDTDPVRHRAHTGADLAPLLANLRHVDALGATTTLRCLLVAGVNADGAHTEGIARVFRDLRHCTGVELLAYHPLGEGKRARFGLPALSSTLAPPSPEEVAAFRAGLQQLGVPASVPAED